MPLEGLPSYDPRSSDRALALRMEYDAVAAVYTNCAYPALQDGAIYHSCMPWDKARRYERNIRRAMLASCETLNDFRRKIYDAPGTGTDEEIRGQLRDAYDRRSRMPYNRERASWPGPFHSYDDISAAAFEYTDYFPRGDGRKYRCKTLAVVEIEKDRVNLCFTLLPGNDLRSQIDYVADEFYRKHLVARMDRDVFQGKRVDVYMHIPLEFSFHGRDEFLLVDSMHVEPKIKGPALMPLAELPRAIDYIFHQQHAKVTDRVEKYDYNEFRGFALRAM